MDALALLRAERQRLKEKKQQEENRTAEESKVTPVPIDKLFSQLPALSLMPITHIHPLLEGTVSVYRDFVTKEEEQFILDALYSPEAPEWIAVRNRRLKCFGGDPVPDAARPALPEWLQRLARFVEQSAVIDYTIDHCLVNEYARGQNILPHTDGPSYHPCVACLSIGKASGVMTFISKLKSEEIGFKSPETLLNVTLEPRSLVVFRGAAYTDALHGIDDVQGISPRVSLTMRKILM